VKQALIIYSREGATHQIADGLARGLKSVDYKVDLMATEEGSSRPISVARYDLICAGSPVLSFWGGKVDSKVELMLKRCTRIEGKHAAAFVLPKILGTTAALRRVMSMLERQGAWVEDFAALRTEEEAVRFGVRLENVGGERGF